MTVEAQPVALLTDAFVAALLRGQVSWQALPFPTLRVIDRQDMVVASSVMSGLRVEDDDTAHADPVFLTNYVPNDTLMLVEISAQGFGVVATIELADSVTRPDDPFWLAWDARGIFRP